MTGGRIKENLSVALDTLRARKARSALTILGIVIGVTSVISVAAIIDGLNGLIQARIKSLGSRSFFISKYPPGVGGFGPIPAKIRMRKYLQIADAAYLRDNVGGLDVATAFAQGIALGISAHTIHYNNEHVERMVIRGVQPDYSAALPLFTVGSGRFISQADEEHARNVAVIGAGIADSLFPNTDPIGKEVRLDGRMYQVVGVFEKDPGLFAGFGVDIFVCIPLANYHKNYPEIRDVFLLFTVREDANMDAVRNGVVDAMRRRRRVPYSADNDFEIADPNFLADIWNSLTGAMALLTGVISSIGLLVGGIGVMNIMLISVTERTSEIGVRKAIGARKSDIRVQFLLEAVTLSGIGGVLGVITGGTISTAARAFAGIPASLSPLWVVLGVAMSVGVGLFFGYYPANRAANLDPIVCLRYE